MTRDVPFDEEVAERDPEAQESLADVRPLGEVEAMRARWDTLFDELSTHRNGDRSTPRPRGLGSRWDGLETDEEYKARVRRDLSLK